MLKQHFKHRIFTLAISFLILVFLGSCANDRGRNENNSRTAYRENVKKGTDVQSWETFEGNNSDSLEAEGIMPADIQNLDVEKISDLNEMGDEGIKKTGKKSKKNKKVEFSEEDEIDDDEIETYFIIAGSFREEKNADLFVDSLKKLGFPAEKFQFSDTKLISVAASKTGSSNKAAETLKQLTEVHKIPAYVLKKQD